MKRSRRIYSAFQTFVENVKIASRILYKTLPQNDNISLQVLPKRKQDLLRGQEPVAVTTSFQSSAMHHQTGALLDEGLNHEADGGDFEDQISHASMFLKKSS